MGFFNFKLLDIWNDPAMQLLRKGTKTAVKSALSAKAKAAHEIVTTEDLRELLDLAQSGHSDAQCEVALYHIGNGDYKMAPYWLEKAVAQGNERALEIMEMLQKG